MTDRPIAPTRAYFDWLRMSWFALAGAVGLMGYAVYAMRADAAPILTTGIPSIVALAGAREWLEKRSGE